MPTCLVIQPSLHLSRSFIDYPAFTGLGAYQAAAVLLAQGWAVRVVDGFDQPDADLVDLGDAAWLGQPAQAFLKRLDPGDADLVLIAGSPFLLAPWARPWLVELTGRLAERTQAPIALAEMVTGGMHFLQVEPDRLWADLSGLQALLRFEGERSIARLAERVEAGWPGSPLTLEEREAFDLDQIPDPAWHLMDLEAYFRFLTRVLASPWRPSPLPPEPARSLPLITARGCPYACIFCTHGPGLSGRDRRRVRRRPWDRVFTELSRWRTEWRIERVVVLDEIPNLDAERFDGLLGLAEELDLELAFPNGLRADRLERPQLARLARVSRSVKVSLESASPRVQREVLGKDLDPASVGRVAAWCQELGLPLQIHYLIGLPGERRDELLATLGTAEALQARYDAEALIQYPVPLPGSALERRCGPVAGQAGDGAPLDLHACFQGRALVSTGSLSPAQIEALAAGRTRKQATPTAPKVIVNLTYRCNNRCRFCAVGDRPARDAHLPAVVAALEAQHARGARLLDIDGGEPSLHPDLFEVIAVGRRLGFEHIGLITNGRRCAYPAFAGRVSTSGVDEVLVSLHAGQAHIHDSLTRAPGSFEQTLAGLGNLLTALGDPDRLAVNTTLVAENLAGLDAMGQLLADLGVRRWNLQLLTPFGRATSLDLPSEAELEAALAALLQAPPDGLRIQVINCPPCVLPGHEQAAAGDIGKAGREMVFVGEQGVNLQAFLAERRQPKAECQQCAWALACAGPYRFDPPAGEDR